MDSKQQVLLCLSLLTGLSMTTPIDNLLADRSYCGYQHTDDYTRPNNKISIDEFPWMAQLLYDEQQILRCSGSLISNRYILTTAHCLLSHTGNLTKVKLGDYNVNTEIDCVKNPQYDTECSDPIQLFGVEETILHPLFNMKSNEHDIGLVRLSTTVQFSDYVRPICLPEKNSPELTDGQMLVTSGWGNVGFDLNRTELKKRVTTVLVSNDKCNMIYKNYRQEPIIEDQLCASESDTFTCTGDSGAPLMHSVKNQWEEVGILCFGGPCESKIPTVYTKIIGYVDWIRDNLRK